MSKSIAFAVMLFAVLFLHQTRSLAQIYFPYPRQPRPEQDPDAWPVEFGGYVAIGGGSVAVGAAGAYGQWNRPGLCPGLDLRIQGNTSYLHGALVGPRLAYRPSGRHNAFHPYFEALFGPNEYPSTSTALNAYPPSHRGVTSAAVLGIDADINPVFRWRVIEFTKEDFTGLSKLRPYTITTGIVFHLP